MLIRLAGSNGKPVPIASPTIDGHSFNLYVGSNGQQTTYSYVPTSEITSFSGDVYQFFTYLIEHEGFSESQYLVSVGAGSEPTVGSDAVFTVSDYSMVIKS